MIRRKRETIGLRNERDFPHLVELALPPGGFRSVFLEIDAFHRERRIPVRRGRSRHEIEQFLFDSVSQTLQLRMHSAIASVGLDFSSDGAGLFPKRAEMSTLRTHFTFRVDTWTPDGESIVEHVAGVEDYQVALATYRAACERWPGAPITLRQGARVIEDSRRLRVVSSQ